MAERHHAPRYVPDVEGEPEPAAQGVPPVEAPPVVPEPAPTPAPEPVAPSPWSMPSAHVMPDPPAPTLIEAFTVLCAALQGHLDDNLVLAQHCDEIQAWMANSGGDERSTNCILAWRHAISILAEVLGQSMTLG